MAPSPLFSATIAQEPASAGLAHHYRFSFSNVISRPALAAISLPKLNRHQRLFPCIYLDNASGFRGGKAVTLRLGREAKNGQIL